ncbi:hypothetical protein [Bradyrhizobium sp. CCGE-LA001]|uniref:hypothetical protein n=1 Tax=Bradyrhizobium sp. CCGE-LA001 TaxID=1223566 RepID=UPI0002AA73AE|nr:hypothetical protein [Bradyrhizobium sp. CCGE-LA001]AMA55043.1 hypothetical protein BCCGELA001_01320 [Bradyrhizobium sp. CCGE-LA001]
MTRAELQSIYHDFAERQGHDMARRVVRWRAMTGNASLNSVHPQNYAALARAFADVASGRDRLPAYTPADDRSQRRTAPMNYAFDRSAINPKI